MAQKKTLKSVSPLPEVIPMLPVQTVTHAKLGSALVFLVLASFAVASALYTEENKPLDPQGSASGTPPTASATSASLSKYPKKSLEQTYAITGVPKLQELLTFSIKGDQSEPVVLNSLGFQITKNDGPVATPNDPACGFISFSLTADEDKQTYLGNDFTKTAPAPGSPYVTIKPFSYMNAVIEPKVLRHFSLKAFVPAAPATVMSADEAATALHGCTVTAQILPQNIEVVGQTSGATKTLGGKPVTGAKITLLAGAPEIIYPTSFNTISEKGDSEKPISKIIVQNLTPATSTLTLKNLPIRLSSKKAQPGSTLKIYEGQGLTNLIASPTIGAKAWTKQKDGSYMAFYSDEAGTADIAIAPMASSTFTVTLDVTKMSGDLCVSVNAPKLKWYLGNKSDLVQTGIAPLTPPTAPACLTLQATVAQPVISKMQLQMKGVKTITNTYSTANSYASLPLYVTTTKFDNSVPLKIKLFVNNATAETQYGFAVVYDKIYNIHETDWKKINAIQMVEVDSPFTELVKTSMTWGTKPNYTFQATSPFFTVYGVVKNGDEIYSNKLIKTKLDDATGITFGFTSSTAASPLGGSPLANPPSSSPVSPTTPPPPAISPPSPPASQPTTTTPQSIPQFTAGIQSVMNSLLYNGSNITGSVVIKPLLLTPPGTNLFIKNLPVKIVGTGKLKIVGFSIYKKKPGDQTSTMINELKLSKNNLEASSKDGAQFEIKVDELFDKPIEMPPWHSPVELYAEVVVTGAVSGESICTTFQTDQVSWTNNPLKSYTSIGVEEKYGGKPMTFCLDK